MINQAISNLLCYAKLHLSLSEEDSVYATNLLMEKFRLEDFSPAWTNRTKIANMPSPDEILIPLLGYAKERGLLEEGNEETFASDLLDILSPRPSKVISTFLKDYESSPEQAFDRLYDLGVKNDYVKRSAILKNKFWVAKGTKHPIEITINLSKPEKNNKQTAQERNLSAKYPKCMLCKENVGYVGQGRTRRNLRTIPLRLAGEKWFWQYSPYAYFHQHGIAINETHTPMEMTEKTFRKILDFVDFAPQYFIGSNAPLPIVGGSILAHEHFQGGKYDFPMFRARERYPLIAPVEGVEASILDWYNSVILLRGKDKENICKLAGTILKVWQDYSDPSVAILAKTDAPHSTLAPIARKKGEEYYLYLQLRNNRTNEWHPDGIFHAHKEYHNIKSESIGLIEAMGRFILPGRLDRELAKVEKFLTGEISEIPEDMQMHTDMIHLLLDKYDSTLSPTQARSAVRAYVETVCEQILYNTAVFKETEKGENAFRRFVEACGFMM